MFSKVSTKWLKLSAASTTAFGGIIATSSSSSVPSKTSNLLSEPVNPKIVTYFEEKSESENPYKNTTNNTYNIQPPIAKQIPTYTYFPWDTLVDNYAWLRDKQSPEVISYLKSENEYANHTMKHTQLLQKTLYNEFLTRIVEDDETVPYKYGGYMYYSKTEKGKPYRIHCRKKVGSDKEEVILDINKLAEGKKFMSVGSIVLDTTHKLLGYSTDEDGNEYYDIVFKNLETGKMLTDKIKNVKSSFVIANDNKTIFYIKYDNAWRPYQLWKHVLGTDNSKDELLFEENDIKFRIGVSKSRSNNLIYLNIGSAITDEVWYIDANKPNTKFECISPRVEGIEYSVSNHENKFLILMNDENAINFQLYQSNINQVKNKSNWKKIIKHDENITLNSVDCFKNFIIINQRQNGLPEIRVRYDNPENINGEHIIEVDEDSYDIYNGNNMEYNTDIYRFNYTSLVTPTTCYDYNINNKTKKIMKIRPVNEFKKENYITFREWATARDGTQIPISLIAPKDVDITGVFEKNPLLLIGYGSYGYPYDVYFSSNRLSLVDRGCIVGYAHIRGGGDFGRKWKLDGKLHNKLNTFQDFIACSEHLINKGITDKDKLAMSGGSAGGLLMGACMNMRGDLYKAVVASVPFVDVINTMSDESIPLTAGEWEEWGDPRTFNDYWYMKSYSPYDNISAQKYPNILLLAGLNDSRVQYWEPAKFLCKLREYKRLYGKQNDNIMLMKTNMGAGHGGASGRYDSLKELAFQWSFVLDQLGLSNVENKLIDNVVQQDWDPSKE